MLDADTEPTGPSRLVATRPTMYDYFLNFPIVFGVGVGYGMLLCAVDALLQRCMLECFPIQNHETRMDPLVVMRVMVDGLSFEVDLSLHVLSSLDMVRQSQY